MFRSMRSSSMVAASSSVRNACSRRSSGRSSGVAVLKSQMPCRSGAPHGVRGASWAAAPAADTTNTAASADAANRPLATVMASTFPVRASARRVHPVR